MPRVVRNFWIDSQIDGRENSLRGGPRSKEGGFETKIFMRSEGEIQEILEISGHETDGILTLNVWSIGQGGRKSWITSFQTGR